MKSSETHSLRRILSLCTGAASRIPCAALTLISLLAGSLVAFSAPPDFTQPGVINALKTQIYYSSRAYEETYNLGPTGLRGWIYVGNDGDYGLHTAESRQILVTVASPPASAVLAVDDVILGAIAASTGDVPQFDSDCRKALGVAIGNAEKNGAGSLRVKRWRAGVEADVNIPMAIMGNYAATAPYDCPKSMAILNGARTHLISQLKANPNFFNHAVDGGVKALALLASVGPGDADYAVVQARLKEFADTMAGSSVNSYGNEWWDWSYMTIFLSEYYLRTVADGAPDASVLASINKYVVAIAKGQSRYGTYCHGGFSLKPDGSLHGSVGPYGPINSAGLPANIAIVIGKKALQAGGQAIDPEIDPAIQRGSDFFRYFVNKGSIAYGEQEPFIQGHASNGKDAMAAVLFGLQDSRPVEAEYFTRMSLAGCTGREYGHSGQGFSYLWGSIGVRIGGSAALTKYMENFRWQTDLARRTNGSFAYDGAEQYGPGSIKENAYDGTYLGPSVYKTISAAAIYLLSNSLQLERLLITGRNANPANTLSPAKMADAMGASTFKLDCPAFTTARLLIDISAYDPVVRQSAATELARRTLTTSELDALIGSITDGTYSGDPNVRMGACEALGYRQELAALTALGQRLYDGDVWVRAKAAQALRSYSPAATSTQRDTMLTAFAANATDPDVIVWDDPVQISNNYLSRGLFGDPIRPNEYNNIAGDTIRAPKNLLYPAVRVGLKQPDSWPRHGATRFSLTRLTLEDVQALTPDLFAAANTEAIADTMWHADCRREAIETLAKHKAAEAIPIALSMMEVPAGYDWDSPNFQIGALNVLSSFGDSARWTLPALRQYARIWQTSEDEYPALSRTIASIEAAITSPAGMINLVAVATPQVVATPVSTAKAITLTGTSARGALTFSNANVTLPAHGTLTGTAPNMIYTPDTGYTGPDHFTFKLSDSLTTSEAGTVSIIVGKAGTGLKGEYFDNINFTNLKLTRTDAKVNFDWGTGSPNTSIGADTFSVRWSGQLLVPETGTYTFSTLNSDGVRLFIDGVPVINDFVDHSTSWNDCIPFNLTAGQRVELQMEYYENTGSAVAKLKWHGPTLAGINGSIIGKEWLYDGTGLTNRAPYAYPQNVSAIQNVTTPITLTGSGVGSTPLVYSIVAQPVYGTLKGAAPNLIYTPAANYTGTDSFTFLVNNGTSNSSPATVSIDVLGGAPTSYFWTNAVSGNWSGAFWSNAAGGSVTPAPAGNVAYNLNFNKPATYTTTQDLGDNYAFNRLNINGAITFAGTSSLSPSANGSILPQINQDGSDSITFRAPLNLAAMTSFGGNGGGTVEIPSLISGPGGLIKNTIGLLNITNRFNTFSGGTVINLGMVMMDRESDQGLGTGSITLNPTGTLQLQQVQAGNALIFNGGTLGSGGGWPNSVSGPITINTTANITGYNPLKLYGAISGKGGITKTGNNTLILLGDNTSTGVNSILAGTLQCDSASFLGLGTLNISYGAKVSLEYTGTRVISGLRYNSGALLAPGTYGSTSSPATNQDNNYFYGSGTVTILPVTSTALALSSGSTPSNLGSALSFTASVSGTSPTGNVEFYDGTTLLSTSALNGSSQASFTTTRLATGSHTITARYVGNATQGASTSAALAIEITTLLASPPTNLFAERGNNTTRLTWTLSSGATSYNVKRSLSSDGPYYTIGTSAVASYNDLTAFSATGYFYVVSANNAVGESANSLPVKVMPHVPSSANDILTFTSAGTISETVINVFVPFGTNITTFAPTYTTSANATGSPIAGTPRNFTTPQTYTITAEDTSTKIYTVTVTRIPNSVPPVTSGLVLSLDASKITGQANGAELGAWADSSGNGNSAARQSGSSPGYPMYVAGALNNKPVVRFNSSDAVGDGLYFNRISNIRTVFWVLKENADIGDGHFLLGDDSAYQFHRKSANGPLWDAEYAHSGITSGTTKLMGNVINGATTSLPSENFQLVSLVTAGNVQANQICQDRSFHGSWQGDIAEILIYDRALRPDEELLVGSYLATKYALTTGYPATNLPEAPTGVSATPASSREVSVSWLVEPSATNYSISYKTSDGGTEQVVTGITASPYIVGGLTKGTSYDFKVAATYAAGTTGYSDVVSATPAANSEKDIIALLFPDQSGATIVGNKINVTVPLATNVTALAPTYTVSAEATGSPVSGTTRNFTVPQTYKITAEDGSTKVYTVTVTAMPELAPPVTNGLVLRMDASKIKGIASGTQLDNWADSSGKANNASRQSGSSSGYPMYVTGALSGKPVVRFNSGNITGDSFTFTRIPNIQTVFWVIKETPGLSDGHFLLGDDTSYQFHRKSANGPLWESTYADNHIRTGTTKLMGNVINGTTTSLPSGSFQVVSLVTKGNVQANQICQDRTAHGSWQGDIAEILIYDRALSDEEELQVGSYLTTKYALPTSYPALSPPAVPTGVAAIPAAPGAISVSWLPQSSATSYSISYKTSGGGTEQVVTGVTASPYVVSGLTKGTSYDFRVAATYAGGTTDYSSVVTATPAANSDKDILTFLVPNQSKVTISGDKINVTVPLETNVTTLAPTYTISADATGNPVSGTTRNFTSPQTYEITAENGSTKLYTVTVTADSGPPVTSGLVLRMDASRITGTANGAQLGAWADSSGADNNAIRQSGSSPGYPKFVTGALNGKPVVRFNSGNTTGDGFKFPRISNIRTVFWVLKENAGLSDGHFLLGDDTSHHFHRKSANGPLWESAYADNKIKNGITKLMGNAINGTTTPLPSGKFQVVSLVTTDNVEANQICQDRTDHGSWQGDIAEILIYNRDLSTDEELQVGSYLTSKYALRTAYPVSNPPKLTYDFNNGTLQGWSNRIWDGTAWMDLAADATTYAGTLSPASSDNGLFVPGNGAVWVSGNVDNHLNTLWLRSPQFYLNGAGDLTVQLGKGIAKTTAPANDLAVPFAAFTDGGWRGVALRRVSDGVFVLNKPRNVGNDDTFRTVTFTKAELATLDFNATYTLELINSGRGGWGWLAMDDVLIPGTAVGGPLVSSTFVASSFNPAKVGVTVTLTATVSGASPAGNVSFYNGPTLLGTSALSDSFQASYTTSSLPAGTHMITAVYAGDMTNATSTSSVLSQVISFVGYQDWATIGAHGLTFGVNDSPMADPDKDGVANLMEFVLGGAPMASSRTILPKLAKSAGNWVFEYNRTDLSLSPATTQIVEYGSNLSGWTPVTIPTTTAGNVEITPGSPSDRVKVTIPSAGSKIFFRLKVSQ